MGFTLRLSPGIGCVLHAIDEASCFQQGRRAMSRHASDAIKALNEFWFSWAGVPKRVYLDPPENLDPKRF